MCSGSTGAPASAPGHPQGAGRPLPLICPADWRPLVCADLAGSTNFVLLALLTLFLSGHYTARPLVLTSLLCLSRLELAAFLLYRVCKREKDARFDTMRESCPLFLRFWVR